MPVKVDQIHAVAFDLDGTLIDTLADLTAAVNATLTTLGTPPLPQARVKELMGDGTDKLVARSLAQVIGTRADELLPRALEIFPASYSANLFVRSKLYPQAVETLAALRENAIRVCCVTNKSSRFALPLLQQAGLGGCLEFTLCADRTEDRKPSPTLLLQACQRLEVAPREMLYVGDSQGDVMAAHAAGCGAVAVTFGYHKPGAFERVRPDALVTRLMDIVTDVLSWGGQPCSCRAP